MKRIFVTADYYLPAYKAGGPIVSIRRIVSRLGGEAEFWIFTRNHDLGEATAFDEVPTGEWTEQDGAKLFYAPPDRIGPDAIIEAIRHVRPDVVYLNSYFSPISRAVLALRQQGQLDGVRIVLAPRGEFAQSALAKKSGRKKAFLFLARLKKLHRGVVWQASSEIEAQDIRRGIPDAGEIVVAPDLVDATSSSNLTERSPKQAGEGHFVFLARIAPVKNLDFAIALLGKVRGRTTLNVYGPEEDPAYTEACRAAIAHLPKNIEVQIRGPVPPAEVPDRLAEAQFFLFPTKGENFGHVVPEALSAGLPVLVSDQTPWLDLESRGAGWVTPLTDELRWLQNLQACIDMDESAYDAAQKRVRAYLDDYFRRSDVGPTRSLLGL